MADDVTLERFAQDYSAGTVLFREGDAGHLMYVIQSGEIEIRRHINDQDRTLAVLPAGEFFGEMAVVNNRPRSATAVVRRKARLLVIESETFEAMLRGKAEIAVRMVKTMAGRLERANQQVELLLLKDANHRVVQCLRHCAERQAALQAERQIHADDTDSAQSDTAPTSAVYIPISLDDLAARVALPEEEVADVLQRLGMARLVVHASQAGIEGHGYVIPEVGRLLEFLEFLELKDLFGSV